MSDLSPAAQAKLLRAIQDLSVERVGASTSRHVDTRIVVASNRPLSLSAAAAGLICKPHVISVGTTVGSGGVQTDQTQFVSNMSPRRRRTSED